jgi:hypothetical protein
MAIVFNRTVSCDTAATFSSFAFKRIAGIARGLFAASRQHLVHDGRAVSEAVSGNLSDTTWRHQAEIRQSRRFQPGV